MTYLKNKKQKDWEHSSIVEHLCSTQGPELNPQYHKKKKKNKDNSKKKKSALLCGHYVLELLGSNVPPTSALCS
jgi:hypothetical protein